MIKFIKKNYKKVFGVLSILTDFVIYLIGWLLVLTLFLYGGKFSTDTKTYQLKGILSKKEINK